MITLTNNLVTVEVVSPTLDEASYKVKLGQWNEEVAAYVDSMLDSFVQSHLVFIVDDQSDMEKIEAKGQGRTAFQRVQAQAVCSR